MSDTRLSLDVGPAVATINVGDVTIAEYVYRPDAPASEAPKPYLYPLRSLTGAPLSVYRPWDHRWHKGLQMTWSHVSGENFWGGPTFALGEGYRWIDNLGSMEHLGFSTSDSGGGEVVLEEDLEWITSRDERWVSERRRHRFHGVDVERGLWMLDFATTIENVSDRDLAFGSPTTHGREAAGYAGFFWRGPRSWTGAESFGPNGTGGEELMGAVSEWIAMAGEHDEIDGGGTVLAFAGTSSADVPIKWFFRSEPFAVMSPSPSFDEEIVLPPGGTIELTHRYVFIDRVAGRTELEALAKELAP
jgi:hypothetical protein